MYCQICCVFFTLYRFINSIICTLIFGFALNILFTTDIICYPFAGVSQKLYFGSSLMISLCIFNFVLSLSAFRKKRSLFHHCCRYLVAMTVLCNTLYTDQMPVCALIVMLIVGSVSTDEVKELHKLLRDDAAESRGSNLYSMFLFVHLLLNYLCQMLLPVMVVALAMANTRQSFQDMYTVSQTIFFLSSAFLLWYSIWRLRRITIAYSNEKSRINARKMVCRMEGRSAVSGIANMDMFSSASGTPGRSSSTAIPMESSSSANPFENVNVFKTKDNVYEPSFTF